MQESKPESTLNIPGRRPNVFRKPDHNHICTGAANRDMAGRPAWGVREERLEHSPEQVAQIAASIAELGFNAPIPVDSNAGIIAAHSRLLAARKLRLDSVAVLDHFSETQRRAYIIDDTDGMRRCWQRSCGTSSARVSTWRGSASR